MKKGQTTQTSEDSSEETKIAVKTVLQVEFSPSLLAERAVVLKRKGYRVISSLGSSDARSLGVLDPAIGVVVIGHGAPWLERDGLVAHFREVGEGRILPCCSYER